MGRTILPLMNRPFDISSGILFLLIFVPFSSDPLRTGCPYIGLSAVCHKDSALLGPVQTFLMNLTLHKGLDSHVV